MSRYHSSPPDHWSHPRPHRDAATRLHTFGKVRPMDDTPRGTGFGLALFLISASFAAILLVLS